jgi:hypothetical protein
VSTLGDSMHFFFLLFPVSQSSFVVVEAQINTQRYGSRPYGVGLLVAGHDVKCLFEKKKEKKNSKGNHSQTMKP